MPTITIFPYEEIREYEEELERLQLIKEFEKEKEVEIKVAEQVRIKFELKKLADEVQSFISSKLDVKSDKAATVQCKA